MDSGKLGGSQKPNFSRTCSLLSQYLKEKGSFGDLISLRLSNNFQPHGASTNLVPQLTSVAKGESGQMTIFYSGQVIVFDEFPADRVKEIITMANVGRQSAEPAPNWGNFNNFVNNLAQPITPQPMLNDLPIARNASLARFLEKRKDRLTAKTPYQTNSMGATSKLVERKGKPWLGLGARPPTKIEHHA